MKRKDIDAAPTGTNFAVRYPSGAVYRCQILGWADRHVQVLQVGATMPRLAYPTQVLMPWPAWEAERKAKADRDAAVRCERTRNEEMVGFELRGKLVAAGVRIQAWDPERRTVTFRWEDAAKLIGGSS